VSATVTAPSASANGAYRFMPGTDLSPRQAWVTSPAPRSPGFPDGRSTARGNAAVAPSRGPASAGSTRRRRRRLALAVEAYVFDPQPCDTHEDFGIGPPPPTALSVGHQRSRQGSMHPDSEAPFTKACSADATADWQVFRPRTTLIARDSQTLRRRDVPAPSTATRGGDSPQGYPDDPGAANRAAASWLRHRINRLADLLSVV
jgi:hypothetical protein